MAETSTQQEMLCPYLVTIGSASSVPVPRPRHRHRCIALGEPQSVAPRTQATLCLKYGHEACPFYRASVALSSSSSTGEPLDMPLPTEP